MKVYKLNSLTTFLFAFLIAGLIVFLPIVFIEALWNTTIGQAYTDININFWQALILWLIVLVVLNIFGVFRFEFAVETSDSLDKDFLKKKLQDIQDLRGKAEEKSDDKPQHNQDNEETK